MKLKEIAKMATRVTIVVVILSALAGGVWVLLDHHFYAMWGVVENYHANNVLIKGADECATENSYWFTFQSNQERPAVGTVITVDYNLPDGEPYLINCWSNGKNIWNVVGMVYMTPETKLTHNWAVSGVALTAIVSLIIVSFALSRRKHE